VLHAGGKLRQRRNSSSISRLIQSGQSSVERDNHADSIDSSVQASVDLHDQRNTTSVTTAADPTVTSGLEKVFLPVLRILNSVLRLHTSNREASIGWARPEINDTKTPNWFITTY